VQYSTVQCSAVSQKTTLCQKDLQEKLSTLYCCCFFFFFVFFFFYNNNNGRYAIAVQSVDSLTHSLRRHVKEREREREREREIKKKRVSTFYSTVPASLHFFSLSLSSV
jgi:hypothetical protein